MPCIGSREVEARARALEKALGRRVTGGALSVLAKETRLAKGDLDARTVASWWNAVAAEHGFGPREAAALRSGTQRSLTADASTAVARRLIGGLEAGGPTVMTTQARAIALESAAGATDPEGAMAVLVGLQRDGAILALDQDRVTTKDIRALESDVLRMVATRAGDASQRLEPDAVQRGAQEAQALLDGHFLAMDQQVAIRALCGSGGWSNLVGRAGTGKGAALHGVAVAHRVSGWQVIACAVDGTTAQRLAAQVHDSGYTIDGLLTRVGAGITVLDDRTLVVLDEASKIDTARWAAVCAVVERAGARVLAVGDTGQLDAVTLPGLFREIVEAAPTVSLKEVRRHRDQTIQRSHTRGWRSTSGAS